LSVITGMGRTTDRPAAFLAAGRRRSDTIGRCRKRYRYWSFTAAWWPSSTDSGRLPWWAPLRL